MYSVSDTDIFKARNRFLLTLVDPWLDKDFAFFRGVRHASLNTQNKEKRSFSICLLATKQRRAPYQKPPINLQFMTFLSLEVCATEVNVTSGFVAVLDSSIIFLARRVVQLYRNCEKLANNDYVLVFMNKSLPTPSAYYFQC